MSLSNTHYPCINFKNWYKSYNLNKTLTCSRVNVIIKMSHDISRRAIPSHNKTWASRLESRLAPCPTPCCLSTRPGWNDLCCFGTQVSGSCIAPPRHTTWLSPRRLPHQISRWTLRCSLRSLSSPIYLRAVDTFLWLVSRPRPALLWPSGRTISSQARRALHDTCCGLRETAWKNLAWKIQKSWQLRKVERKQSNASSFGSSFTPEVFIFVKKVKRCKNALLFKRFKINDNDIIVDHPKLIVTEHWICHICIVTIISA